MMEGTISLASKKTGGFTLVEFGDKKWFNPIPALTAVCMNLIKGEKIQYNTNEKGDVIEVIRQTGQLPTKPIISNTKVPDWDAKEKRIVRQSMMKAAVELAVAGKVKYEDTYLVADAMVNWVYTGESPV